MLAAPARDWSVFQHIFADHWEPFQRAHPRYQTAYYDDLVAKMLACGNPEKMGYLDRLVISELGNPLHCRSATYFCSVDDV